MKKRLAGLLMLGLLAAGSDGPTALPESPATGASAADSVVVTYVANEGVLLAFGATQVLIDGLHRPYQPAYAVLPEAERERLETAQASFDRIDLVLVSHVHGDHFHAEAVGRHLRHNPGATLIASQQVADSLARVFGDDEAVAGRIRRVTPAWKERVTLSVAGVELDVLGLRHSSRRFRWIQNLGHVVRLGGKTFLHVGDAELSGENFERFALPTAGIDVAFLPYWFLLDAEGRALVATHIRPKQIVAVHVSPDEAGRVTRQIHTHYPNATVFSKLLESRVF